MFLSNDRDLLSLRNKRKKNPTTKTKENPTGELFSRLNKLDDQAQDLQPCTSWWSLLNLLQCIHAFPVLWDTKLETAALQRWHSKCWGQGGMMGSVSLLTCSILHTQAPSHWALLAGAVGWCCQDWLRFSPAGPLGPALHPTLQLQELGPSMGQDLDFVLIGCHMRFLQSQSSQQPCPPACVSPPYHSVWPGRERGLRTWLRKQNSGSCCSWFLGLE